MQRWECCVGFLEQALEHGASINDCNELWGMTPLQAACARDLPGIMAMKILDLGADPLKETSRIKGSCLSVLAFNRLGPMTLRIVERMVQKGCTYDRRAYSFTNLYWKAVRDNDHALQTFILSQAGASKHSLEENAPLGSLLHSLLLDNTAPAIGPIVATVNKIPRPSLVDNNTRSSLFHVMAAMAESSRNEVLHGRLSRFFATRYDFDGELLNLVNKRNRTAAGEAVLSGNHVVLEFLLRKGANPSLGRYPVPVLFITRIMLETSVFESRPEEKQDLFKSLSWQQELNRMHRNTVRIFGIILKYMPETEELKHISRQRSDYSISKVVKKWREKKFYERMEAKAVSEAVDKQLQVNIQGTDYTIQGPDGLERSITPAEEIRGAYCS